MHSTVTWRSERIDEENGEIRYEVHGPRDSFVVFEGPNAKADCEAFMRAVAGMDHRDESGWLLEMAESPPSDPRFVTIDASRIDHLQDASGCFTWGANHHHALRFSRKIDAVAFVAAFRTLSEALPHKYTLAGLRVGDSIPRVCEHVWTREPDRE